MFIDFIIIYIVDLKRKKFRNYYLYCLVRDLHKIVNTILLVLEFINNNDDNFLTSLHYEYLIFEKLKIIR